MESSPIGVDWIFCPEGSTGRLVGCALITVARYCEFEWFEVENMPFLHRALLVQGSGIVSYAGRCQNQSPASALKECL